MSAAAFFDSLGDARSRWLNGDADAWPHYVERCLRLEAELRSAQRASTGSSGPTSAREPGGCRPAEPASTGTRREGSSRP